MVSAIPMVRGDGPLEEPTGWPDALNSTLSWDGTGLLTPFRQNRIWLKLSTRRSRIQEEKISRFVGADYGMQYCRVFHLARLDAQDLAILEFHKINL